VDRFFDRIRVGSGVDQVESVCWTSMFIGTFIDDCHEGVMRVGRVSHGTVESGYQYCLFSS
jgi:hypothetical protein